MWEFNYPDFPAEGFVRKFEDGMYHADEQENYKDVNKPVENGHGMLEVMIDKSGEKFSVMCDECSVEWKSPNVALKNINGYRGPFSGEKIRSATLEEIKRVGWEKYILKVSDT